MQARGVSAETERSVPARTFVCEDAHRQASILSHDAQKGNGV
jgi:hypothetical protein